MSSDIIAFFFQLQTNLKLYHWMTTSYARHKGSDQLIEELSEKIDRFVEVYIGRNGKPKVIGKKQITYCAMTDKEIITYLRKQISYVEELDLSKQVDLDNIRGEIVEAFNQGIYLFALD